MEYNNLLELRKERGHTQNEMAGMLGIGVSTYNMYENGQRKIPKNVASQIAKILSVEINEIFLPMTFTVSKTKLV